MFDKADLYFMFQHVNENLKRNIYQRKIIYGKFLRHASCLEVKNECVLLQEKTPWNEKDIQIWNKIHFSNLHDSFCLHWIPEWLTILVEKNSLPSCFMMLELKQQPVVLDLELPFLFHSGLVWCCSYASVWDVACTNNKVFSSKELSWRICLISRWLKALEFKNVKIFNIKLQWCLLETY